MRLTRPRLARARALPVLACLLALLGLLAAPARAAESAQPAAPAGQAIQASLENAAFKDFLLFMGQFTGLKPVFREDQLPRASVSLVCRQGASAPELEAMFALALDVVNLAQTRRGDTLYVLPAPSAGGPPPRPAGEVQTQILVQRLPAGQDPEQTAQLLERLRSDVGVARASVQARAVALRDMAERVTRARAVLTALAAAPAGARAEIVPLRHAQPGLAARTLEMHFKGLTGRPPAVLALEWSNSVLLAGGEEQLAEGLKLLARMDEGGREAQTLRAFRLRFAQPAQVAEALEPLAKSEAGMRVRVDAEAGAVVVLAGTEGMARAERLVAELDRPRPRVLVEAVVAEFPPDRSPRELALAQGAQAAVTPEGNGRSFALALTGSAPTYRGKAAPQDGRNGLDGLAALLAADPKVRVLARPRAAVQDGGEMRVSAAQTGQAAGDDRFRLTVTPHLPGRGAPGADGPLRLSVSLEDALNPGAAYTAEARLDEGAALVLISGGPLPAVGKETGWTLVDGDRNAGKPARLVVALSARMARPPAPPRPDRPVNP